ncbi:hypothetical protein ACJX0J_014332, partial [Zea mays]
FIVFMKVSEMSSKDTLSLAVATGALTALLLLSKTAQLIQQQRRGEMSDKLSMTIHSVLLEKWSDFTGTSHRL